MDKLNRLDESRLEKVTGGIAEAGDDEETNKRKTPQVMLIACKYCKKPFEADVQKDSAICPNCGKINPFFG